MAIKDLNEYEHVRDLAAVRAQEGVCPGCGQTALLYREEPTDPESRLVCPDCVRREARRVRRYTPCDNDPEHGPGWRNPKTRKNRYLCGRCHVESGEGVVLNKWAGADERLGVRQSLPLGIRSREECAARNVPGTKDCRGEVKPRGPEATPLCNAHAGKESWADSFRAGDVT